MDHISLENKFCAHNYNPLPDVVLTHGNGSYLYDTDGNEYIDMMSAYSAVSLGHNNPEIKRAATEQMGELSVTSRAFYTDILGKFLEELCAFAGFQRALPMNTGAEAVETAIKAARRWGYVVKGISGAYADIIVAKGNFHGRTTTIVGFSSEPEYKANFGPFAPGFTSVPFGDARAIKAAITPNTCAVLLEPIQGEAGIIIPPDDYLLEVEKICNENEVLFILDEIQTGLGRTGKDFCFQHYGIKPDCLILGKALGGGIYPVSAFLADNEVMDLFEPGSHGSTFGGSPLAAAIGHATIGIIKRDQLACHSAEKGEYLLNWLSKVESPLIHDVRGKGLFIGVEFGIPAREVCKVLAWHGLLSKETHETVVRFAPPLNISFETLDAAIVRFIRAMQELDTSYVTS